jgi:hypothetical protein
MNRNMSAVGPLSLTRERQLASCAHQVYGLGFCGGARPFVVGYVNIGYGSEGIAVFTGLNYPFHPMR